MVTVYDVTVEEGTGAATQRSQSSSTESSSSKGSSRQAHRAAVAVKVTPRCLARSLSVKASAGQAVKKGDVFMILEAMKMENEVVAPQDGTVASIDVAAGDSVEAGAVLATLN